MVLAWLNWQLRDADVVMGGRLRVVFKLDDIIY